jgi:hypothetical protein
MSSRFLREPSEYMKQAYFPEWKPSKKVAKDLAEGKSIPSSQIPDPIVSNWAPAPYLGAAVGFYAPIFRNHYVGLPSYYSEYQPPPHVHSFFPFLLHHLSLCNVL